jgi:glycosyltransferase involved in cell wall biosynthesis
VSLASDASAGTGAAARGDRAVDVLADSQYADWLGDRVALRTFGESLADRSPRIRRLATSGSRIGGLVRGLLLFRAARGCDAIVVRDNGPGVATLLFCEAWLRRRRRIVLIEFLRGRWPRPGWRQPLYRLWVGLVRAPALRRAVAVGHVLSRAEADVYAREYGVARDRLEFVPWPWRQFRDAIAPRGVDPGGAPRLVLSSGRAYCDWATLLDAARGRGWRLIVVCSESDAALVRELADDRVEVRVEIPRAEHAELLAAASVYAIVLEDTKISAGQVRLMHATQNGIPVVATRTTTLADYVVDGETALLVPPGDPAALRAAIERLLDDPGLAESLRTRAWERSGQWVRDDYLDRLSELIRRVAVGDRVEA